MDINEKQMYYLWVSQPQIEECDCSFWYSSSACVADIAGDVHK